MKLVESDLLPHMAGGLLRLDELESRSAKNS